MLEHYYFISNATFKNSREANVQVKVVGFITIKELNAVLLLTKLMHETVPREQQKEEVFIQSHKHSFQGSFFLSVTLNSFIQRLLFVYKQFSILLIAFFPKHMTNSALNKKKS